MDDTQHASYQAEAKERWGHTDAYKQSEERAKKRTEEEIAALRTESDRLLKNIVSLLETGRAPTDPLVQEEIAAHRAMINTYYDCTDVIYEGLATMYTADPRFANFYRTYHKDLPEFLSAGMRASLKK